MKKPIQEQLRKDLANDLAFGLVIGLVVGLVGGLVGGLIYYNEPIFLSIFIGVFFPITLIYFFMSARRTGGAINDT